MKRPILISEINRDREHPRYPHIQGQRGDQEAAADRRIPARTRKPTQRFTLNLREGSSGVEISWLRLVD